MSGALYIRSLFCKQSDEMLYHAPERGVFHCHYAPSRLAYFGLSWFDIDEQKTEKECAIKYIHSARKRESYLVVVRFLPVTYITWLYEHLKDREPCDHPVEQGEVALEKNLIESCGERIIEGDRFPYKELIAWRDELCAFLRAAIKRNERIETHL